MSTPSAGKGFAAPSYVGGSGDRVRQHCGQRAVSAASFKSAAVSAASVAAFIYTAAPCRFSPCIAPPNHCDAATSSCRHCDGIIAAARLDRYQSSIAHGPLLPVQVAAVPRAEQAVASAQREKLVTRASYVGRNM